VYESYFERTQEAAAEPMEAAAVRGVAGSKCADASEANDVRPAAQWLKDVQYHDVVGSEREG
jgi:hypothetical protein